MRAFSLVLVSLGMLAPPALPGQTKRAITIDEFINLKTVGDPQLSPDGQLVAYTVSTPSLEENKSTSKIWVVPIEAGSSWQFTTGPGSDRAPRWRPDGKAIAFISTRENGAQIWLKSTEGGEPTKLTSMPNGVSDLVWAPDAKAILFVTDLKWPDTSEVDRRGGEYPTDAKIWTGLYYRHWDEWRVGRRQHVFRLTLADLQVSDITPMDRDVPPLALGGRDLAVSPVGTEMAVVYNPDPEVATSTNNDIFVMGLDGSVRQAITTSRANDHSPLYSPDSRNIAYLAMSVPGFESDRQEVMLYERATGRRRSLTADWALSVSAFTWLPNAASLIAEVEERGGQAIYRIDVSTGKRTRLISGGVNSAVQVSPNGDRLVFLHQTAVHPPEVYVAKGDGGDMRPVTKVTNPVVESLHLAPLEPFGFIGALGDSVFGWTMKPPGFDPTARYPLIYLVHGGPQGAWLDQWSARWNYAMFAARGYVVAAVNFHGSTGYGQKFTNSISRHWGDYPFEDLMKGLDEVAARPYVDARRMGAAGASYGGYMIFWMAGHTDRFKVLVAHDGVFNPVSMIGSTEELWFPLYEFGGSQLSPAARATMEKWSPANYLANWTTPMLVIHGQQDFRVDVSEGLQAYTALRLRGIPSKFLYFPDEGHWVLGLRNRRLWYGVVLDWFDGYLK